MTMEELIDKVRDHIKDYIKDDDRFKVVSDDEMDFTVEFNLGGGLKGSIRLSSGMNSFTKGSTTVVYYRPKFEYLLYYRNKLIGEIYWDMYEEPLEEFEPFSDLVPHVQFDAGGSGEGIDESVDISTMLKHVELFDAHLKVWEYVDSTM